MLRLKKIYSALFHFVWNGTHWLYRDDVTDVSGSENAADHTIRISWEIYGNYQDFWVENIGKHMSSILHSRLVIMGFHPTGWSFGVAKAAWLAIDT